MKKYALFFVIVSFLGCQKPTESPVTLDSRYFDYISGFTTGVISKKDNITIEFSELVSLPEVISNDLLKVSPKVDGQIIKTASSIVFSPKEPLHSGTVYEFSLALFRLAEVPDDLRSFDFSVQTIQQDFEVTIDGLRTDKDPKVFELLGTLETADHIEDQEAEKLLSVKSDRVEWNHTSGTSHQFKVKEIKRSEEAFHFDLKVSGNLIGVEKTEDRNIEIPSTKDYSLRSIAVNRTQNNFVTLSFTDPLEPNQNLEGLISIEGEPSPKFVIDGNQIQVYLTRKQSGSKPIHIQSSIRNIFGYPLKQSIDQIVAFDPEHPQVKLVGTGSILPSSDGLVLPFDAVNLRNVRVSVVQIFKQNIPHFLQANGLDGNDQIKRYGRKIIHSTIDLTKHAENLSNWNRFNLDLSTLFETEKGAIYQVTLQFKPEDSVFPCEEASIGQTFNVADQGSDWSIFEEDGFDYWGDYSSYYYPPGYRWDERDNPCHVSYYSKDRFVKRNLLSSDLGLIAKIGSDNSLHIYATNMITAQPIPAEVMILDYQLQTLDHGQTDGNGMISFKPERRPFLVIAESNGQKSYLKLDDGSSLSLSNFDVSGNRVKDGIKGYIYGERGVWRPGDDIYLSFALEDMDDRVPFDQPVIFELRDPRGNLKDRQVATESVENLYLFKTKTEPSDITGNWRANIKVGNAGFSKQIKVETIKPNRLKINLDLGVDKISYAKRNLSPNLSISWLTGLKGDNLKAETVVSYRKINTTFDGYSNFEFDDPQGEVSPDRSVVFQGTTDPLGKVSFNYQMPVLNDAGGAVKAIFETKGFEPGGNFSVHSKSITYYPYESFVGLQLPEGDEWGTLQKAQQHKVKLVSLQSDASPTTYRRLIMKIYQVDWRWWWDRSEDYSINYIRSSSQNLVLDTIVNTKNGQGIGSFKLDQWGRYLVIVEDPVSGHTAGDYLYIGWSDDDQGALGASFMTISSDKQEYKVGEDIELSIPGTTSGQALVSIENGSSVIRHFWTKTEKGTTKINLKALPEMAPNVYAHVTLLQPHAQSVNDLPIRLYGIAPLKVSDPQTILEPEITMSDELAPGKEVKIVISEKNNTPMAYSLAIVDEGLLDITNFQTPDIWGHFYSREAIGVKTWDLYDQVIGAYGGRLEKLLAIGGDSENEIKDKEEDKPFDDRFKPVVQFMGPFFSDGKSQSHSFIMPQYIGSVKTMVVASRNGSYGSADKSTPVIQPLMVLGTMPRITGPGERIKLPVSVFKFKENIKNADIIVETKGIISLEGPKNQSIDLSGQSSGSVFFDLFVSKEIGYGKVMITAKSGKEESVSEITIESRAPNTQQTQSNFFTLDKGQSVSETLSTFGMPGTNSATLEISTVPSISLDKRLQYLIRYPHGCIEQTVSSAFPQLYLGDITQLTADQEISIQKNITEAIEQIKRFQTIEGGFSYWPGMNDPDHWGTTYGHHFLLEAEQKGYFVPKEIMKNLKEFQDKMAKNWIKSDTKYDDEVTQAYRLFTLALAGHASMSSMNKLLKTPDLLSQTRWRLGAAYSIIGKSSIANDLITSAGTHPSSDYNHWYSYGSETRDLAMLLESYTYMNMEKEGFKILQDLAQKLSSDRWFSTQTTAYSLLAISKYLKKVAGTEINATVDFAGKTSSWSSELPILRSSLDVTTKGQPLGITNQSDGKLFVTLTTSGVPFPGEEPATNSGLSIQVNYYNQNGENIAVEDIDQGQTADVEVIVKNNKGVDVRDCALSQVFPSGWEINNDRINDNPFINGSYDYQDIRDDRIYTYFQLSRGEVKTIKSRITATYAGMFYLPGAYCEAMYDATTHAKSKGQWITIVKK